VGLLEQGFKAGDRLAVYLQNVPQFVIAMLAAWKAGGIMVSINPMNKAREVKLLLDDSGARALVTHESLYDEVAAEVVPDTNVDVVITTSELDYLDGVPGVAGRRAAQPGGGHARPARARGRSRGRIARPGRVQRGRRRVPHLHLGYDRPAQGGDEHPRQCRVQLADLPGLV
jgi:hypothetical protein